MFKRLAILFAALPMTAGAAGLSDVAATLRATSTMTADFTQTAPDGRVARGRMIIARPGKIRFDYENKKLLIVSDGSRLSMIDYDVAQVSQWPVKSTPLGVLLDPDKDLSRVAKVVGETPGALRIEARDSKHPEYGAITMTFLKQPGGLALTGWTSLDAQNMRTEVILTNVRSNVAVGGENFKFRDPRVRTPGRAG